MTTDLGSATDEGLDAALLRDGGFVVVGRTDGPGFNRNFAIARYHADGTLDTGFGGDGIVTTDFAGQVDQANSVAVQPDGKIVVAGLAARTGPLGADNDFAIARYLGDGTLDTQLRRRRHRHDRPRDEDGHRPCASPSSRATAASSSPARPRTTSRSCATPPTAASTPRSANGGVRITDLGSDDFANAVALTADGQILVAGHTLGSAGQPRLRPRPLQRGRRPGPVVRHRRHRQDRLRHRRRLRRRPDRGRGRQDRRRRPRHELDHPRHGGRPLPRRRRASTPASAGTGRSPPTSTEAASSGRTSPSRPTARSSRPATPPTASTRSSRSCGSTRDRVSERPACRRLTSPASHSQR